VTLRKLPVLAACAKVRPAKGCTLAGGLSLLPRSVTSTVPARPLTEGWRHNRVCMRLLLALWSSKPWSLSRKDRAAPLLACAAAASV
jgi:hypothetical protein